VNRQQPDHPAEQRRANEFGCEHPPPQADFAIHSHSSNLLKYIVIKEQNFENQDAQAFSSNQLDCGDTHLERQRCACSFAALERIAFGGRVQRAPLRKPPRHLDPLAHCRQ
jgi:hypothetical protein